MKHKAFFIFMTALLIGSPLYAQKYKIALIHSYQEGYSGAGIVNKLFVKGLKDQDRKSTRLNSSHIQKSRMPSSA